MTSRIKKWVVRPLLILVISLITLIGIAVTVLLVEQDRLVAMAISELNKNLKGELTIEGSKISPFKHFPYISVGLKKAKLFADKTKTGRPIVELDKLYVGFSLPDILRKDFNARKLSLHGGFIELVRDKDGNLNLLKAESFQDSTASSSDTTSFAVNLQNIALKDLTVSYRDETNGHVIVAAIESLQSSFQMTHQTMVVKADGTLVLDYTSPSDTSFFRHKNIALDLKADYKEKTKVLEITEGAVKLQDASFALSGSADLIGNSVDFHVKGDKPDLSLFTAFLPGDVKQKLKPFKYDGEIYFDGTIKGSIANSALPRIDVSFGCKDGWFLNTGADKKVDMLGFSGKYTNGVEHSLKTSELHITDVTARPEKGIFKGNFVMRDFTDPHTLVQINSELELKFLGDFLGIPDLQQIRGKIKLDMNFKELDNIKLPEQSLNKLKEGIQSKLTVEGLYFSFPGYPYDVQNMNLRAEMQDGKITIDSASFRIGSSDVQLSGSLSDIQGFLHDRDKIVTVTVNAASRKIALRDLFAADTARAKKMKEEINNFNIGLIVQTSVDELLHPSPLPKGKFELHHLRASFNKYPHVFKDLGATLTVNDTAVLLKNFAGMIDRSDFKFSGRVIHYQLWFDKIRKGKTQIAFDFKSNHFAMDDILGPRSKKFIPEGYRKEEASNIWLRSKIDLKYDTVFRFAKAHIANISGDLKVHNLKLKDISGNVKFGRNKVLVLDTLKGMIGRSDFDVTLHVFAGKDAKMKKRTNYLKFNSKLLDLDEISNYDLVDTDSTAVASTTVSHDTSKHAKAFNIFTIPFLDFRADINIGKIKYEKLWLKEVKATARMTEDHHIYLDTIGMKVADGTVGVKGELDGTDPSQIFFKSTIDVEKIDLEKIMLKLDHFGQDVVINKNIKGRLSGRIVSNVLVHPNFVPQVNKTKAELDINIYDGSLNDFAPLLAMSSYFKDKNLRRVRFDTLQNKITFNEGVLKIPSMDINSSIGYIQLSGKQSMDLSMEYYVRVPMKLVTKVGFNALFDRKPEEVDINQIDQIDYSEKDKKIRFMNLKVTGKPEDFKVGLGKAKNN